MKRLTVHFSGRVQGVGFRYRTARLAESFDVCGYVRNLADGRVELVAEGEPSELGRFVDAVKRAMAALIADASIAEADAVGEFSSFGIRH